MWLFSIVSGKGRLYPAYSLSGSEGEDNTSSLRSRAYPQNNHQTNQSHHNHYNTSQHKQRAVYQQQQQQHPLYHMPGSGAGLSDTPTSGNASDETLTDSDLITVARDSALLVHNGEWIRFFDTLLQWIKFCYLSCGYRLFAINEKKYRNSAPIR